MRGREAARALGQFLTQAPHVSDILEQAQDGIPVPEARAALDQAHLGELHAATQG